MGRREFLAMACNPNLALRRGLCGFESADVGSKAEGQVSKTYLTVHLLAINAVTLVN